MELIVITNSSCADLCFFFSCWWGFYGTISWLRHYFRISKCFRRSLMTQVWDESYVSNVFRLFAERANAFGLWLFWFSVTRAWSALLDGWFLLYHLSSRFLWLFFQRTRCALCLLLEWVFGRLFCGYCRWSVTVIFKFADLWMNYFEDTRTYLDIHWVFFLFDWYSTQFVTLRESRVIIVIHMYQDRMWCRLCPNVVVPTSVILIWSTLDKATSAKKKSFSLIRAWKRVYGESQEWNFNSVWPKLVMTVESVQRVPVVVSSIFDNLSMSSLCCSTMLLVHFRLCIYARFRCSSFWFSCFCRIRCCCLFLFSCFHFVV